MSGFKLILKVFVLAAALGLCVYSIVLLRSDYGAKTLEALGFQLHSDNFVAWCQTRVHEMKFAHTPEVFITEKGNQWTLVSTQEEPIRYLEIEKWLGEFCQVKAEFVDPAEAMALSLEPLLQIQFIDSTRTTIYRVGEDKLQIGDKIFSSPALERGLQELARIMRLPVSVD